MTQANYLSALNFYHSGQLSLAELTLRQIIALQTQHADALHLLGVICYQTNRATEAIQSIEQALLLSPRQLNYLNNYGLALRANNQLEAALKSFGQAILLQPKDLDVQLNIANTLLALNRFEDAAGYYRRILRAVPNKADVKHALCHCLSSLGNHAHAAGGYTQAETYFKEAVILNAQDAAFYYNLGNAQRELGKPLEAAKQFEKAILLNPNDADAYNNLGNVQRELGQLDRAITSYEKALQLNPKLYHAKVHLVHQKQHICDWQNLQADIAQIRHWVNTIPEAQISPFAFLAMPNTTAAEQKLCANHWVENRYAGLIKLAETLHFNPPSHQKTEKRRHLKTLDSDFHRNDGVGKIKIGYLSADFRLHPLAFLISELIELHDRNRFEIIAFSYGINDKSSARARLEKAFDQFYDIRLLPEVEAAKKIKACEVDILVDLTGFTQTSRSGIVALRPAPIHVNWLGFAGTMGGLNNAPLFDYILTDNIITPPEAAQHYAEKLALLPHCYQPNDRKRPIGKVPTKLVCGLPEDAFVFCCFNQTFKITPDIFAIWMRLLNAVPNSVLWLLDCNPWAKQNLINTALGYGIAKEKLVFAPRVSIADHLARHTHANLFLDTLPYNAHTTCSDALWMDVPVLSCTGDTFAARVASSLLHAAGIPEMAVDSLNAYESKALTLASDANQLKRIQQKLIQAKLTSPLFDTALFAKSVEAIYQSMWEDFSAT